MPTTEKTKASKKELILEKASSLFRKKGFVATSMRDLAENVGVEAASLYNHIQSKAEMLQLIISRTADECANQLDTVEKEDLNSLQKIEALIRFHVQMMLNSFENYHVMTHEWIHLDETNLTAFINQRNYVQRMEAIIEDGIQQKEIKTISPYVAVLTILSAVRGLEFWHRSQKIISPQELEDNMVLHLISGLENK
jgi:TetR/AcrR family transcriptional regulator, cholesterol catabolism regulator